MVTYQNRFFEFFKTTVEILLLEKTPEGQGPAPSNIKEIQ
jgi:hypothetical protein